MTGLAYVVLVLGIVAIGAIVSASIWGVGKVIEGIVWLVGLVLRPVAWIVGKIIGWSIRGVRAASQAITERRYAATRRRRK